MGRFYEWARRFNEGKWAPRWLRGDLADSTSPPTGSDSAAGVAELMHVELSSRPAAAVASRRRRRRALVMLAAGAAWTAGSVSALLIIAQRAASTHEQVRIPALFIVFGPVCMWQGWVWLRGARLLRRPGTVEELQPWSGPRSGRSASQLGAAFWLVPTTGQPPRVGIPVAEQTARRMVPTVFAVVRGQLAAGGRVVVEFPEEIVWPTDRVVSLP